MGPQSCPQRGSEDPNLSSRYKTKKENNNDNAKNTLSPEAVGFHSKAAPEPSERLQVWQNEVPTLNKKGFSFPF